MLPLSWVVSFVRVITLPIDTQVLQREVKGNLFGAQLEAQRQSLLRELADTSKAVEPILLAI